MTNPHKRALVIDADPVQSQYVHRILDAHDVTVTISDTAADGISIAISERPDLAIIATDLPDRSGFGVCRALRRDPQLSDLAILLMSRDVARSALERHSRFRSRADGYLMTPFSGFELWRRAEKLLSDDQDSGNTGARHLVSTGTGPSILLIDPDDASVNTLRDLLQKRQCDPVIAASGAQGLALCEQRQPDLVILSLELASSSGFSVCKRLRRHPVLANTPIFLTSSQATPEVFANHQRLRSRADVYLHKPFAVDDFWRHVEIFLPLMQPQPEGPLSIG